MTTREVQLELEGMTCASCAMRIEKKLNKLEGVTAAVNFATEQALVQAPEDVGVDDLVAQVRAAGYDAHVPPPVHEHHAQPAHAEHAEHDHDDPTITQRLVGSAVLTLPVLLLSMIEPLQFDRWQWLSLMLAAPVVTWGAWPFHRMAWRTLRHGSAGMDTLISLGVLAAFGWSLWALFLGEAGEEGMTMGFCLDVERGAGTHDIYLEVASAVTEFILAGRYLEARAKRTSGAALRALLELGAKDVAVLRSDGTEERFALASR